MDTSVHTGAVHTVVIFMRPWVVSCSLKDDNGHKLDAASAWRLITVWSSFPGTLSLNNVVSARLRHREIRASGIWLTSAGRLVRSMRCPALVLTLNLSVLPSKDQARACFNYSVHACYLELSLRMPALDTIRITPPRAHNCARPWLRCWCSRSDPGTFFRETRDWNEPMRWNVDLFCRFSICICRHV